MIIDVVTLFPSMFEGVIGQSILKNAQEKDLVEILVHDLRSFSADKHKKVDAPPYGGGPGMVLTAEPVFNAVRYLRENGRADSKLILLTPAGKPFKQVVAQELSQEAGLIFLCGHYEGFDERIIEGLQPLEISVGDFVLTGGEIPAMAVLDSVTRLIPGVLGAEASLQQESFSEDQLEYPHYTRPASFEGMDVPPVLLSGDHRKIEEWRSGKAKARTGNRRPDLLRKQEL
ncbi:MAG: tRNA (guanosine(37)-N1)-methyltransferase TrmD [Planctomycetota bacterium]|jgi:tRNA (guanine37-N1)-methyltransferase|nr:tRNA (guanosine(37)-N1)-methyltransferase TrmD [Planctomycetota bacterium]